MLSGRRVTVSVLSGRRDRSAMESWRDAFESMTVSEFVQLVEVWVRHARDRLEDGEVVCCSCVCLDKKTGVYNLIVDKHVTPQFLEDQERAVHSIGNTKPTELVFVGQTVNLMGEILAPGNMVDLDQVVCANVHGVEKRIQPEGGFTDYTWMIETCNCMYVLTEYRQMFAFACGENTFRVVAKSRLVMLGFSSWVEMYVDGIRKCYFTENGEKVCPITTRAKEYKGVTMHVKSERGVTQFPLSELYLRGTRIVSRWYKSLGSGVDDKRPRSPSTTVDDDSGGKRPRIENNNDDSPELLAAVKVIMAAARAQVASVYTAAIREELKSCQDRLSAVIADRDRLKGIFDALTTRHFMVNKNKK